MLPTPVVSRADPAAALPPTLQRLAALGVQRRYRRHAMLIEEGDEGGTLYIVLTGQVRAFVSDARGREVTLGLHGPGEYVGEMSLDGGPRSASIQATEATLCAVVGRETMLRQLAQDPELAQELIMRLIKRARLATQSARSMALLDVYSRLKALLESRSQPQGGGGWVMARLTHQAMASEIGCSREMVSRLWKDLESGGYVTAQGSRLLLLKPLPAKW
ncbi:Crp/Fnr family transcriptional regulator [Variovorax sp. KK3]|uniref:Crp/Fnr family transcriptional regulator n=1 Tax=Variovorax sp. KK3 TaxID=1855728 RepID=UPI00097C342E|nr:Crp/Fnr family transcriptional regulator [Variovorax sp. KK3]